MVGEGGARKRDVTRERKDGQFTAKHMEEAAVANSLVAPKVPKAALITVLPMVADAVAVMRAVSELRGENLAYALGMEVARGARWRIAPRALKATLACVFPMGVVVVANFQHAPKGRRGARCSARHTVEGRGVLS